MIQDMGLHPAVSIGWAEGDITPLEPVGLSGQFQARVSEGVLDPLTVTAWVLHSNEDHVILVSCDLSRISDDLWNAVRDSVRAQSVDINPMKIVLNATHSHTAPHTSIPFQSSRRITSPMTSTGSGVDLDLMPTEQYVDFAARRIADTIIQAWNTKEPGGIAFGLGYAELGHNRRWVDGNGVVVKGDVQPTVSHIEGYEDHSLNLLAVYDGKRQLTGLVVNVANPAQVTEGDYTISADYWHETRIALRQRFGKNLFILPQCSAAGEISPGPYYDKPAYHRMLSLKGRSQREDFAWRIAEAVSEVLPYICNEIDMNPKLRHVVDTVELKAMRITEEEALQAQQEVERLRAAYEAEMNNLEEQPELRKHTRWYAEVTGMYRVMNWNAGIVRRFERQKVDGTFPAELHVIRLGQLAIATNPFEMSVDFGIQIKVQSPAVQTFLVQLAGAATYLPSRRSCEGGNYGAIPGSCYVGYEGGHTLVQHTVQTLRSIWES